jgi:prepilin-type N-terminal cleavage/methylation domain-containing protein
MLEAGRTLCARGFTLVELLVVMVIIVLVSAATLPFLGPAILHRQVSEAARIFQAGLVGARDIAIRANAPRGIRLIPDPAFLPDPQNPGLRTLAYSRYITIQPGPNYNEGRVTKYPRTAAESNGTTLYTGGPVITCSNCNSLSLVAPPMALRVEEEPIDPRTGLRNAPTSWYWNIRRGDQLRFGQAGRQYSIVGPVVYPNPEGFINVGLPGTPSPLIRMYGATPIPVEYLLLTNGQDDNGNGVVDEGFDASDNNSVNGIDEIAEWEAEVFVGAQAIGPTVNLHYVISRRPVPSEGAREVTLPSNVVIDATTWNASLPNIQERSRLPVDPSSFFVDIMLAPNGQVMQTWANGSYGPALAMPFYQFWFAEREDVVDGRLISSVPYLLPMPPSKRQANPAKQDVPYYPSQSDSTPRFLKGERRLITLFTKTGQITTNMLESFDGSNPALPFLAAQSGAQEEIQ